MERIEQENIELNQQLPDIEEGLNGEQQRQSENNQPE